MAEDSNTNGAKRQHQERVVVTMTPKEKRALRIASAIEGNNMSDFVRNRVIDDAHRIAGGAMKSSQ